MATLKNDKPLLKAMDQHARLGCPRCSSLLKKRVMRKLAHPSGAILDVCDRCGGMWLDRNEVKILHSKAKSKKK